MFASKTAIVVGGCGAIGSSIARRLADLGCTMALIDQAGAADHVSNSNDSRAMFFRADLAQVEQTRDAMAKAVSALNGLDILVNAAGITSFGSAATLTEWEWDRVIDVNLKGVFICCQSAIGPLKARGGGRIVNVGSVLGKNGGNARPWLDPAEQDRSGNIAYGISKAGVHVLTAYLARELASFGIMVNAVAPGPIVSGMTTSFPDGLKALIPLGRMGVPREVADAVVFLASEGASFITGETVAVNGGMWAD